MDLTRKTLESGLRLVNVKVPDLQTVTVMCLVGVGSRFEKDSERGLAHFVEHTIFKGTKSRPSANQIALEIELLGGSTNAFTSYDYTGYFIKAPRENFSASYEILADMVQNSLFAEPEIDRERGVISEEIRMYEDRPPSKVSQLWQQNYFEGNALGLDIIGTQDSIAAMRPEQFRKFIEKHYYPENMVIVTAGQVSTAEATELATEYYQNLPTKQTASEFSEVEGSYTGDRELEFTKPVEQAHVIIGGRGFPRQFERRYELQVANALLGNGFGSRLFQVIREELGLAYYVYSRLSGFADTGTFNIGMGVDPKRRRQAIDRTQAELAKLAAGEFSDSELDRARNILLGNLTTELEASDELASFFGIQELLQTDDLTLAELRSRIANVSRQDVQQIYAELFDPEQYLVCSLGPNLSRDPSPNRKSK